MIYFFNVKTKFFVTVCFVRYLKCCLRNSWNRVSESTASVQIKKAFDLQGSMCVFSEMFKSFTCILFVFIVLGIFLRGAVKNHL